MYTDVYCNNKHGEEPYVCATVRLVILKNTVVESSFSEKQTKGFTQQCSLFGFCVSGFT